MRKVLILAASPRKNGNTNALVNAFCEGIGDRADCEVLQLYDYRIGPCMACRGCQQDWERPSCVQKDDMTEAGIFDKIMEADTLVLATPVYAWYCTAPMKALLDRCVYALNKYYGRPEDDNSSGPVEKGPSIWQGKRVAIITTCGYKPEKGADLLEEGIKRYCRHSGLEYAGMLAERHLGYRTAFMDEAKADRAAEFAAGLLV